MPDDVNLDGIRTMVDASGIQVHYGATRQPTYYPAADKVMMPAYSFSNQTTTS
jgi:antirestriction protein ArdC